LPIGVAPCFPNDLRMEPEGLAALPLEPVRLRWHFLSTKRVSLKPGPDITPEMHSEAAGPPQRPSWRPWWGSCCSWACCCLSGTTCQAHSWVWSQTCCEATSWVPWRSCACCSSFVRSAVLALGIAWLSCIKVLDGSLDMSPGWTQQRKQVYQTCMEGRSSYRCKAFCRVRIHEDILAVQMSIASASSSAAHQSVLGVSRASDFREASSAAEHGARSGSARPAYREPWQPAARRQRSTTAASSWRRTTGCTAKPAASVSELPCIVTGGDPLIDCSEHVPMTPASALPALRAPLVVSRRTLFRRVYT
jgi:hypothetical protein